jgi:thioredoxin 1
MEKFKEIISGDTPVLVEFFATWCPHCQRMMPVIDEVRKSMGDRARVVQFDIDKNGPLASKFGVDSVPTMMIFRGGEMVWRDSGEMSAEELEEELAAARKHVGAPA